MKININLVELKGVTVQQTILIILIYLELHVLTVCFVSHLNQIKINKKKKSRKVLFISAVIYMNIVLFELEYF